ncbi:hypothetical protein L218DRAFT_957089 [Marasmius fiardii PR-910]|nr:hypothetical protein L218DRAFT_957089 [Marasmius fiardii PR-910]
MHDGRSTSEESEDSKLNALAESIQDSLSLYSKELIDDIADTLVPAVNRVKHAHGVLNREMDGEFAEGLHDFVQGCRVMEDVTNPENDRVAEVYCESQVCLVEVSAFLRSHAVLRDLCFRVVSRNCSTAFMMLVCDAISSGRTWKPAWKK